MCESHGLRISVPDIYDSENEVIGYSYIKQDVIIRKKKVNLVALTINTDLNNLFIFLFILT